MCFLYNRFLQSYTQLKPLKDITTELFYVIVGYFKIIVVFKAFPTFFHSKNAFKRSLDLIFTKPCNLRRVFGMTGFLVDIFHRFTMFFPICSITYQVTWFKNVPDDRKITTNITCVACIWYLIKLTSHFVNV